MNRSGRSPSGDLPVIATITARLRAAGCVFAEDEAELILATAVSTAEIEDMVTRRAGGRPLEHVLGWVAFCGERYGVDPGVFVPRRRTEHLVAQAIAMGRPGAVVVDLCCGCGAVGAAVATALDAAELHATDIDPTAVACARRNLAGIGQTYVGDLDAALPTALRGRVDLLVANVPYVPTAAIATLPPEARDHEPRGALDGGPDGLDVLRRVAAAAPGWLVTGGHVLVETDELQADRAAAVFAGHGLQPQVVPSAGTTTVLVGTRRQSGRGRT